MSNLLQITQAPTVLPSVIEIRDLTDYSDERIVRFATYVSETYLEEHNKKELMESLKPQIINRIRKLLIAPTEIKIRRNLKMERAKILELLKVYNFAVCGYITEPDFMAPTQIWSNEQIEDLILEFINKDENTHEFGSTRTILDFFGLYLERINREC